MAWQTPKRTRKPNLLAAKTPEQLRKEAAAKSAQRALVEPWKAWTRGRLLWVKRDLMVNRNFTLADANGRTDWLVAVSRFSLGTEQVVAPEGTAAVYLGEYVRTQKRVPDWRGRAVEERVQVRVTHHFLTVGGRYLADPVLFREEDEEDDLPKNE